MEKKLTLFKNIHKIAPALKHAARIANNDNNLSQDDEKMLGLNRMLALMRLVLTA